MLLVLLLALISKVETSVVSFGIGAPANQCSPWTGPTNKLRLAYSVGWLVQSPRSTEYNIDHNYFPDSSEIFTICEPGCPPACCKTEACKKKMTAGGFLVENVQSFIFLFGGIDLNLNPNLDLSCYYKKDAKACLDATTNEAYMVREDGTVYWLKLEDGSPKPPRLFGHKIVFYKSGVTVYLYIFGGRTPDHPSGVNSEVWRFIVPYTPIAQSPIACRWEKVTLTGTPPIGVFGHSLALTDQGSVYLYGGITDQIMTSKRIFLINLATLVSQEIIWTSSASSFTSTMWDGTVSSVSVPPYPFEGRVNAMVKFESNRLVVIDGFLLDPNTEEVSPINQIASIYPDATGKWVAKHLKFEDETFRQGKVFSPYCYVSYSSNIPPLFIVGLQEMQTPPPHFLFMKNVVFNPLNEIDSTYNEVSSYNDSPHIDTIDCQISVGRGMIILYGIRTDNKEGYIFATKTDPTTAQSLYLSKVGINFCLPEYSGILCLPNCPGSISRNDLGILEKIDQVCLHRGTCIQKVCQCIAEYTGDDCASRDCPNNCSNNEIYDPIHKSKCIQSYPENYCQCSPISKRGGEDCSKIFCLNECGGNGICNKFGVCECKQFHHGPDCSILEISLYLE